MNQGRLSASLDASYHYRSLPSCFHLRAVADGSIIYAQFLRIRHFDLHDRRMSRQAGDYFRQLVQLARA